MPPEPLPPYLNGGVRWQILVSAIGLMVTIVIGIITYTNQIAALSGDVKTLTDKNANLERRINDLTSSLAKDRNEIVVLNTSLREIETQFCASDIVRNLMHANELRTTAMLWQKIMKDHFPTDNTFYPTICNRQIQQ